MRAPHQHLRAQRLLVRAVDGAAQRRGEDVGGGLSCRRRALLLGAREEPHGGQAGQNGFERSFADVPAAWTASDLLLRDRWGAALGANSGTASVWSLWRDPRFVAPSRTASSTSAYVSWGRARSDPASYGCAFWIELRVEPDRARWVGRGGTSEVSWRLIPGACFGYVARRKIWRRPYAITRSPLPCAEFE